jgi:mannitol-specific phosphotransferase system IIBC component
MSVAAIGSTCLGVVVGWLVRYFLYRFKKFDVQILGSTVSLLTGGIITIFFNLVDPNKEVIWFYPIGLLVGFVIYSVTARWSGAPSKGSIYYTTQKEDDSKDQN